MWPLTPTHKQTVTISFYPDHFFLCWIQTSQHRLIIRASAHIHCLNYELLDGLPYNPTFINKQIQSFLTRHNIIDPFIIFGLSTNAIQERFITQHSPHFDIQHVQKNMRLWHWNYQYLYPHNDQFIFYVVGINHQALLQYHLLAINASLNLIATVPHNSTQFMLYQFIRGSSFRHTQLALDMAEINTDLTKLITPALLSGIIESYDQTTDPLLFKHACGLFISQRMMTP